MESFISGCGKFNRSKDKDLIEARSALVQAWIDDVERAVEKVDKNLPDTMASHIADICYRESERLKKQTTMERKIGEIFEYNGDWYQCVEQSGCAACSFRKNDTICHSLGCSELVVKDSTPVIFKKLEKVGEPYNIGTHIYQRYKVFMKPYIFNDSYFAVNPAIDDEFINIEVKQNKENMEEKNLKPFDLQKAREGKPVCTRDGRKARIICFDAKCNLPIIALITQARGDESLARYNSNGRFTKLNESDCDLMMLPEKKEGWAVIRRSDIYETEEKAKEVLLDSRIGVMIRKIEWEE